MSTITCAYCGRPIAENIAWAGDLPYHAECTHGLDWHPGVFAVDKALEISRLETEVISLRADLAAATERAQKAEQSAAEANQFLSASLHTVEIMKNEGVHQANGWMEAKRQLAASETARKQAVAALKAVESWRGLDGDGITDPVRFIVKQAIASQPDAAPNAEGTPTVAPAARPPA